MTAEAFREFLKEVLPGMGYRWRRFDRRNIRRRVIALMEAQKIHDYGKYARLVQSDPAQRSALDSVLRLTITRFFRNGWLWSELKTLIARTDARLGEGRTLRAWSAGCAGGEEAFSLAMLLDELSRTGRLPHPYSILATDTDPASLERAREASYRWGSVREVPPHLLDRWFTSAGELWTLAPEIRDLVEFRRHDLLTSRPPGRFHLVFLRNSILTYNTPDLQERVLAGIRECLLDPGYLVIGRTEKIPEGAGFIEISRSIYGKGE